VFSNPWALSQAFIRLAGSSSRLECEMKMRAVRHRPVRPGLPPRGLAPDELEYLPDSERFTRSRA